MKRSTSGRRALPRLKPGRKARAQRVHLHLVALFGVAAVFLGLLNVAVILTPVQKVVASVADNVTGWAWSSTGGWLSMNNTNAGAGGGTYGVHIDPVTKAMTGFAWSGNQGWVCFGSSCSVAACTGATPSGGSLTASVDASNNLRGWAKFCNLAADGWLSLSCLDTGGAGSCATSNYGPIVNFGTGVFSGFAWNGIAAAATNKGWGWVDFSGVRMGGGSEGDITSCHDGIDNDLDGQVDCADNGCYQQTALNCPAVETQCGLIGQTNCCANTYDDDNDAVLDCADVADCGTAAVCQPEVCTNGMDDNLNGLIDCADTADCQFAPACTPEICDNTFDDNANGQVDCADASCNGFPACTPAWIQSQFGNVYAQQGVSGNAPPPGETSATYCITSAGSVTNFTSQEGCIEAGNEPLNLPTGGSGYVSNLGKIDVAGILAGRYGQVVNIANDTALPAILDGKVYVYDKDLQGGVCPSGTDFVLNAKTFNNASGSTQRGNGLLVIKGCDLRIAGNLSYQPTGVSQYLRNLASFGVLVLSKYSSGVYVSGGNMKVQSAVSQIVGLNFAERSIQTGTTGGTDIQLKVYGALVSRDIQLQRRYGSPTEAAEDVIFDGRGVVNPPPGTQDITKSLPSLTDTF